MAHNPRFINSPRPVTRLIHYSDSEPQDDLSIPPDLRPAGLNEMALAEYATAQPNNAGCKALRYEVVGTWVEWECHCGNKFWSRIPRSQVRGCRQAGKVCQKRRKEREAGVPGNPQLALEGQVRGNLTIISHIKGRGWMCKCKCGREKYILNSTALNAGSYKSCGQCTEDERRTPSLEITGSDTFTLHSAQSVSLRDPSFAGVNTIKCQCAESHSPIEYDPLFHADGCPLCIALAKIELMAHDDE